MGEQTGLNRVVVNKVPNSLRMRAGIATIKVACPIARRQKPALL